MTARGLQAPRTRPAWPLVPPRAPRPEDFQSPVHTPAIAARLGLWLGVAFTLCFVTGLASHLIQHPPAWFGWPTRPVNLYRITQGMHVLSGIAAIPLLLAKLWSVYPRLFSRPPCRPLGHALGHAAERLSILVPLAAAFFELATGLFNVAKSYPWRLFFPVAHYAAAWLAIGALVAHIGVKLPVIRSALDDPDPAPTEAASASRRAFLRTTWGMAGITVLATAGATVPWLSRVSPLSWRTDSGPQGLPVNRTAAAPAAAVPADWRLEGHLPRWWPLVHPR